MHINRSSALSFELVRYDPGPTLKGTPGELTVRDREGDIIYECKTLELDWRDNKKHISCVPASTYFLTPRRGGRFYRRGRDRWGLRHGFWVRGVPRRTDILLHWGNWVNPPEPQSQGCVLLGQKHGVKGTYHCVWGSVKAYRALYRATLFAMSSLDDRTGFEFVVRDGACEAEEDLTKDRSDL